MTQLKDICANASHLLHAAKDLEGVMRRIKRRPAGESLRRELDDAMAEVVSVQKRGQRLAVLINEARAFQPDDSGPSGTACDVVSFAKAGGPRPKPRAVPAPTGDEFDEPRARTRSWATTAPRNPTRAAILPCWRRALGRAGSPRSCPATFSRR